MNDLPTQIVAQGDSWYEAPGCHHKYSANASDTEDFIIVATFVVESKIVKEKGYGILVIVDDEYRDIDLAPSI
jgi:quercetin dioxygenase-like cupin family protein